MKTTALAVLIVLASCSACGKSEASAVEASHPKYSPGQVWRYKTRAREPQSRAVVLRVDRSPPVGFIVHVALNSVEVKSPTSRDGVAREIAHLPFSEAAVDRSVVALEGVGAVPDFAEGYRTWWTAFDQQKAGFWSTTFAEAVDAMEDALNRR